MSSRCLILFKIKEFHFFFSWPEAGLTYRVDVRHSDAGASLLSYCLYWGDSSAPTKEVHLKNRNKPVMENTNMRRMEKVRRREMESLPMNKQISWRGSSIGCLISIAGAVISRAYAYWCA